MRDADRERWVTSKEAICQIIETIYSYKNYVFTTNIPIAHDIFASLFLRTTLLPLRTSKCRKMLQKANERNVIIKNTFYWNDYVQAATTQSVCLSCPPFFPLLPILIQLRVLCLFCAPLWPWPTWRMSNFVASGLAHHQRLENATQQDILFMQNIKIHIYIYVCLYMSVSVCVCVADPSSRQQLNLSVVR